MNNKSLRFDVDWQGGEIEKSKDGKYLLAEDVRTVLLDIRQNYEHGLDSSRFDLGGYAAIQLVFKKLDLI